MEVDTWTKKDGTAIEVKVCHLHQKGECKYGAKCRFSHAWWCLKDAWPVEYVFPIWSHAVINFTRMVYHTDGRPKLGPLGTNAAYQRCIPIIYIYILINIGLGHLACVCVCVSVRCVFVCVCGIVLCCISLLLTLLSLLYVLRLSLVSSCFWSV